MQATVFASVAKQSKLGLLRRFAPRNDEVSAQIFIKMLNETAPATLAMTTFESD